jgi:anthranilate phosphoribosyltransferase
MLDSYRNHGPKLETSDRKAVCFGVPYDGRSRTAPLLPLLALVLTSAEIPVVLHGSDPMPIKYGVTLAELFAAQGIE